MIFCAQLYREGKLTGTRKDYPITVFDAISRKDIIVNNNDELIELLSGFILEQSIDKEKAKLDDALFNFCIGESEEINSIQLMDKRTEDIIMNYEFYKNAPHLAFNNQVWFESVIMLNKILDVKLF